MKKNHLLTTGLLFSLLLGGLMRGYQIRERFLYTHDNDLNSWIVKDVLIDGHLRLIGQQTSASGIFIGPLFYYLLIPFYQLTGMDPAGSLLASFLIGLGSIISLYYVVGRLHGRLSGNIAATIYAVSELISATEREVVPTTPVMLWTIWAYLAVNLVFQKNKTGFIIAAVLFSLVWHINLALILLAPIFAAAFIWHRRDFSWRDLVKPSAIFFLLSLPLIIFEFRHGFIQTKSLAASLLSAGSSTASAPFIGKIAHVLTYAEKNINHIFWTGAGDTFPGFVIPLILTIGFVILLFLKKVPGYLAAVFSLWMGFYILFFAFHPINLSEYYLNGMNIFWLIILSLIMAELIKLGSVGRLLSLGVLTFLITVNLRSFLSSPINNSGYLARKEIVSYIAADSRSKGYPCISISYITNPGYELGYRYFFYRENLHVNQPKSGSPVYTIVFPHSLVDRLDRTFGALGLILPDYSRYSPETVKLSCMGENANLTDPMFGFTK